MVILTTRELLHELVPPSAVPADLLVARWLLLGRPAYPLNYPSKGTASAIWRVHIQLK